MPEYNGRRRPSWIRAFFNNKKRARGTIAASIAGGVAVLPEFSLDAAAHFAILFVAALLGGYVYFRSQDKEVGAASREHTTEIRKDDSTKLPFTWSATPALIACSLRRKARRLVLLILDTTATAMVSLLNFRTERARRRLRLPPTMLPPQLTTFEGRSAELAWLHDRHDRLNRRNRHLWTTDLASRFPGLGFLRSKQRARGPRMLFVYGRLGIGKSALVNEFARSLRHMYPHGQLHMNMGVAGGRRSEREILRDCLKALGWPEEEFRVAGAQAEVEELGKVFRAATSGRRLLVVLDGTRDMGQIEAVLPGGDRCLVIVTSRMNLSGTEHGALKLDTPDPAEAARILRAYLAGDGDLPGDIELPSPELIAEASHLCGRQPIALRAIGDRARATQGGLGEVVRTLRDPRNRLEQLAYGGRDVAKHIATEYGRISRRQQEALQALALIHTPSFVPWVLAPLLDIGLPEAAALMADLSEISLLDDLDTDPAGFPRYGFSPLIRLFAERELRRSLESQGMDSDRLRQAKERFCLASVVLANRVRSREDPDLGLSGEPEVPDYWIPAMIGNWEKRVLECKDFWIRSEFANLIDAVLAAYDSGFGALAWTLCAQLGDNDSNIVRTFTPEVRDAFGKARDAASTADSPRALATVMVAEGSCLVGAENYAEAIPILTAALHIVADLPATPMSVRANRLIGQAEQRLGRYSAARRYLRAALSEAERAGLNGQRPDEVLSDARIVEVLIAENDSFTRPSRWRVPAHDRFLADGAGISHTEHLVAARRACRHHDARTCQQELKKASDTIGSNESYAFQLELQRILSVLESHGRRNRYQRADIIAESAYLAITAAEAGAMISSAQARILLAQALLEDGQATECLKTLAALHLDEIPADETPLLRAQTFRLQGEAHLVSGTLEEAQHALAEAVKQFGEIDDFWGQAESQIALGRVQLQAGRRMEAQVTLLRAIAVFEQCTDTRNARRALSLLVPSAALLTIKAATARGRRTLTRLCDVSALGSGT
jgi:tetratricopeptide (TPR) repeat protein